MIKQCLILFISNIKFWIQRIGARAYTNILFDRGAISWKSSKQDTVADSTTDSEYIAASEAAKEAVWIRRFIFGLELSRAS